MASGIAKTAGPIVIERMVGTHFTVGVHIETGLLNSATRAPVHPCIPLVTGDLPAFVVGVVIRAQIHVGGERYVPHPSNPVFVLPDDGAAGVDRNRGQDFGAAHPGPHFSDCSEEPDRSCEFVPPVIENENPAPVLHLLELPFPAARRHVPSAPATTHHLHVVSAD